MAMIAFSAFLTTGRADIKGQNDIRSALPYCRLSGARVARQRCPTLQSSSPTLSHLSPFKIGHLYFAVFRTFLLCIDMGYSLSSSGVNPNRRACS